MAKEPEDTEEEEEDFEQVLFQGPMFDRDAELKKHARLVKAALVPAKRLVSDALSRRSHTILLEPAQGRFAIRFVVDGIPYPAGALPGQRGMAMVQMLKLLAGLDPQNRTEAQSGGIYSEFEGKKYELLLETAPVRGGAERLRIRVEDPKLDFTRPREVGMPEDLREKIRELASDPKGFLICCGPPESGLTSLTMCVANSIDPYLFSVFNIADLGTKELANVTEYEAEEGHDLEVSLDRIIRREADVVYVNPLTDPKETQLLFEYTNRLMFVAEMPAANPAEAVRTLIDWVGPEAVMKGLRAVFTQKLIRRLCDDCKQAFRPNPALLKKLSLPPETTVLYRAPSPPPEDDPNAPTVEELCEDCDGVPYYGRTAAYEMLEITDGMKEVIAAGADPTAIRRQMAAEKMKTLQTDALRLIVEGKTSLEEVQRTFAPPRRAKGRPRR